MLKINTHEFKTDKNVNIKIVLLADIHYSEEFKKELENKIIENIKKIKPDYICLPGDIIDSYPFFYKEENIQRVRIFLEKLSKIAKIYIAFGSHDLEDVKHPIDDFSDSIKKWKSLFKNNKNIYILDNELYSDAFVNIIGITLPGYYYSPENGKVLGDILSNLNLNYEISKYNILLIHSPRKIIENIKYLDNIDLVLSGHMHDGAVPKFLKWIPGSRGIIGPHGVIFPKYSRGVTIKNKLTMIVTGGITKVAPSHLKARKLINKLYNNDMEVINIRGKYE